MVDYFLTSGLLFYYIQDDSYFLSDFFAINEFGQYTGKIRAKMPEYPLYLGVMQEIIPETVREN